MDARKFFLVSVGALAGFAGGLIVSGRLSATQSGSASPSDAPPAAVAPPSAPAPGPTAPALPNLSPIAERAIQASVNISSTQSFQTSNWFRAMGGDDVVHQTSLGSGVIVSTDGYVLTNSHVAQASTADIQVTLPDDRKLPAKVIGIDVPSDLALLKVAATGLNPLPWGDSSKLRVAEWVLAVGNPFQFSRTVTQGIVSNVNRHDPQLAVYNDFIQTDAAINPGNSGGALVDSRGELVGINTLIYSETGGYVGIGFAIPAALAQQVMTELRAHGSIRRGAISGLDPGRLMSVTKELADNYSLGSDHGVLILDVSRGSAAAAANLQRGDIIMKFNGTAVDQSDVLQRALAKAEIGSDATLEVLRGSRTFSVKVPVSLLVPRPR